MSVGSELRVLAAGLVLGRLVLRKPAAPPAPVVVRIAEPASKPSRKRDFFTNNAVVAGIVSAVVAGVISYLVVHYQTQDAARQALASQQTQELIQIQQAANSLYESGQNVVAYELKCSLNGGKWNACAIKSPDFKTYSSDWDQLSTDLTNVSDTQVVNIAVKYEGTATNAIFASDKLTGFQTWIKMLNIENDLDQRCGELIKDE